MSHVLIVQSNPWLLRSFKDVLFTAEHTVTLARSSEEAIIAIEEIVPNVVVLDEALRGAGGIELIHEMRSYADWVSIPVILCVHMNEQQLQPFKQSFAAYGIVSILQKSTLQPDDLLSAVNEATLYASKKV
jgi:CheY-like chemotaxis protein